MENVSFSATANNYEGFLLAFDSREVDFFGNIECTCFNASIMPSLINNTEGSTTTNALKLSNHHTVLISFMVMVVVVVVTVTVTAAATTMMMMMMMIGA